MAFKPIPVWTDPDIELDSAKRDLSNASRRAIEANKNLKRAKDRLKAAEKAALKPRQAVPPLKEMLRDSGLSKL